MLIKRLLTALFLAAVASSAYSFNAPGEEMKLGQFLHLVGTKLERNFLFSDDLSDENVHLFGTSNLSDIAVINAVLHANSLKLDDKSGVLYVSRRSRDSSNFSSKRYTFPSESREREKIFEQNFSGLSDKIGNTCTFSASDQYTIIANCPSEIFTLVDDFYSSLIPDFRQIRVNAVFSEVADASIFQVGAKFGLESNNFGATYTINENILSQALQRVNIAYNYDIFSSFVSLIDTDSKAQNLFRPNMILIPGVKSTFNSVQQVPISVLQSETDSREIRTKIEYRDVGIILTITAFELSNNRIKLDILSEVSSIEGVSQTQAPLLNSRKVTTSVILTPGEVLAYAGLLTTTEDSYATGIPLLRSMPWLGRLFGSVKKSSTTKELSLMISAHFL